MTQQQWAEQLQLAGLKRKNATWEIAWLLVAGQRQAYDANFSVSSKLLGYSTSWCYAMWATGRAFPPEKAHPDLSFSCHRELLREEDEAARMILFSRAIEEKWSQLDAKAYFDEHPPTPKPRPVTVPKPRKLDQGRKTLRPKAPSHYVRRRVVCGRCGEVFPVKGHKEGDVDTTEPAVGILKAPIDAGSMVEAIGQAQVALREAKPGGSIQLAAVDDDGQLGGRVALTFKRIDDDGDTFSVGGFAEFTARGQRQVGGVVAWEW